MNIFKEMIAKDNLNVFINFNEFGEEKSIDEVAVMVVVDSDLINERPRLASPGEDVFANGVFRSTITFFVRKEELGYVPEEGQLMQFGEVGGREYQYIVSSVSEAMGIIEVTIEANKS